MSEELYYINMTSLKQIKNLRNWEQQQNNKTKERGKREAFEGGEIRQTLRKLGLKKWKKLIGENCKQKK